jgi:hypothetical protein
LGSIRNGGFTAKPKIIFVPVSFIEISGQGMSTKVTVDGIKDPL